MTGCGKGFAREIPIAAIGRRDGRAALLSFARMGMAVKLPGVDDVVENTVETAVAMNSETTHR